jgi:formylglycine-generating enzyme required for sulfatase activity
MIKIKVNSFVRKNVLLQILGITISIGTLLAQSEDTLTIIADNTTIQQNQVPQGLCGDPEATIIKDLFVLQIPAGSFIMGSPETEVNHNKNENLFTVELSAFKMSKYEITNAQYAEFLNTWKIGSDGIFDAGSFPDQILVFPSSDDFDWGLHYTKRQWIPAPGYENYPVINVTWYGAAEFAKYAGGRLPTCAEWEYACRAYSITPYNTGECLTDEQANYDWSSPYNTCVNTKQNYTGKTQPVGSYNPNAFGLYDMHGNVWEWCNDWYGPNSTVDKINPKGPNDGLGKVIRGGSWANRAQYCRSAILYRSYPDDGNSFLGFRIVK